MLIVRHTLDCGRGISAGVTAGFSAVARARDPLRALLATSSVLVDKIGGRAYAIGEGFWL